MPAYLFCLPSHLTLTYSLHSSHTQLLSNLNDYAVFTTSCLNSYRSPCLECPLPSPTTIWHQVFSQNLAQSLRLPGAPLTDSGASLMVPPSTHCTYSVQSSPICRYLLIYLLSNLTISSLRSRIFSLPLPGLVPATVLVLVELSSILTMEWINEQLKACGGLQAKSSSQHPELRLRLRILGLCVTAEI